MSDAAFKSAKFPSYTTAELKTWIDDGRGSPAMVEEVARREKVAAGDWSVMTAAERLRAIKAGA